MLKNAARLCLCAGPAIEGLVVRPSELQGEPLANIVVNCRLFSAHHKSGTIERRIAIFCTRGTPGLAAILGSEGHKAQTYQCVTAALSTSAR